MASGKIQNTVRIGGDAHGNVMVAGENNRTKMKSVPHWNG